MQYIVLIVDIIQIFSLLKGKKIFFWFLNFDFMNENWIM